MWKCRTRPAKSIGTRHYENLIKETIFDSTMELMQTAGSDDQLLPVASSPTTPA